MELVRLEAWKRFFVFTAIFCVFSLAGSGGRPLPQAFAQDAVTFHNVVEMAKQLSAKPFKPPEKTVPEFLLKLKYDDWRDIRFKPEKALWSKTKLPFTVQFFHPGLYYDRIVQINLVDTQGATPVQFSPDMFDYGKNTFKDSTLKDLGFAGFRLHYPINVKDYQDEVAVFLGGSYFRAVAKDQNYGLSARALAIDTALPTGEEFPYFKEFWLLRPAPDSTDMNVFALLDTPSLTGAYRFNIRPGKETSIEVTGRVYPRKKVEKLCIAPLTSMFLHGELTYPKVMDDFRPEVHDSDGLMVAGGSGEWIWRPLNNPRSLLITSFQTTNPGGFGLIQRDQDFDHYQDLEAHYQNRPSVWISPLGEWGEGRVELVQIPSDYEYNDNIIAYWVPSSLPAAGKPVRFAYRVNWHSSSAFNGVRPPSGRVVSTRITKGKNENARKFIIDFVGKRLEQLPANKPLTAVVTVDPKAKLVEQQLHKNSVTQGWRLVFQVDFEEQGALERVLPPHKRNAFELRAFLKLGDNIVSETWSYAYQL